MDRFDPFVKYADVYGDIINWEKDPMNKPQNQNKYFFSDGKTYYEQICKMLRLMSVFKEAFNQIYSNEDEISEAWENFVNNLSASVVEGSEPDVTLTWTDDSVNFEFTMVPGVPGEQGVGITSISFNSDYTMTITLSDGNTYTSMSLKGETGPQGPQGETGSGLQILDVYATLADLQSAHPTGQPGDAYQVGSAGNYTLYIWSSSQSAWVPAGSLGTVSPSLSNPLMDGTASAGSQNLYSRGDHVHPTDTSRASKEELDALIKTSQSLIDQSFTYRESPAIQDGLAKITDIKGNTLVWNQLVQNGDFSDGTNRWSTSNPSDTISVSDKILSFHTNVVYGAVLTTLPIDVNNHVLLVKAQVRTQGNSGTVRAKLTNNFGYTNNDFSFSINQVNVWTDVLMYGTYVTTPQGSTESPKIGFQDYRNINTSNLIEVKNVQVFDLTLMGLDITDPSDFTSLFPLSYYSYNQGSLLSFNGNGIKTVGKNLFDEQLELGTIDANGNNSATIDRWRSKNYIPCFPNTRYVFSKNGVRQNVNFQFYNADKNYLYNGLGGSAITTPSNAHYLKFFYNNEINVSSGLQLEFGTSATPYEPYTSSTLSLPISTYFPTGMKSAGNVYDELTPVKATTRLIKTVVDGTNVTASYYGAFQGHQLFYIDLFATTYVSYANMANLLSNLYETATNVTMNDKYIRYQASDNQVNIGRIYWNDDSYTSASAMNTALQSNPLEIISLAQTQTETAVDLDLDFMAYENGTEQLLPVNGSVPSTSPVIADMTYLSIDDAMEYIIDKLSNVPQNTQQILESLEDDVADLQTDVGALQPAVSALQTSVRNINTNIGQLSSTVAGHTASISDVQSDITDLNTDLGDLSDTVTDHTSRIGTLENGLSTTNGNVQNLETSVSDLDDTVTAQDTTVTALDSIIQDISNNPVVGSLGSHELGFVAAYVSATLAANTGTKVTIPKPVIFPNNYTPLFIVGMSTGSYNVSICEIPYSFGNRDSVDCRVWNHGGQQTTQITVYILCMRQRQSQ